MIYQTQSATETQKLGQRLGQRLQAGDVLCLSGDLGAGKTTFIQGIGQGWGLDGRMTSPTFVIVRQYDHPDHKTTLFHLDTYRIQSDGDAESIGLDDMLSGEHIVLIEWAEHVQAWLPEDHLWVTISVVDDTQREFAFSPSGNRATLLINGLQD